MAILADNFIMGISKENQCRQTRTHHGTQRRPLHGLRRSASCRKKTTWKGQRARRQRTACMLESLSKLHVLQFNAGSVPQNLNEVRSRILQEQPDLVIIQEDWLRDDFGFSIPGYTWHHRSRTQRRTRKEKIPRGGGVSILTRCASAITSCERRPEPQLGLDLTTEIIHLRLRFQNPGGMLVLDIINLYRPPLGGPNSGDIRVDNFDIQRLSDIVADHDALIGCDNKGILFCGDFNAHSKVWDSTSHEDKSGRDIASFLQQQHFCIANDGAPTYQRRGVATAVDLTCCRGDISISDWTRADPIGNSHHSVLSFDLVSTFGRPFFYEVHSISPRQTKPNWKKANWDAFNCTFLESLENIKKYSPPPTEAQAQVHYYAHAIEKAFALAGKQLSRGCFISPIPWHSAELDNLLALRHTAWQQACTTDLAGDWIAFEKLATKTRKAIRSAATDHWRSYCDTLSYSTTPHKVASVINAMKGDRSSRPSAPLTESLSSSPNTIREKTKQCYTDKAKAELLRKHYAKVSGRAHIPRSLRHKYRKLRNTVKEHIKQAPKKVDVPTDPSPFPCSEHANHMSEAPSSAAPSPPLDASSEFSLAELIFALRSVQPGKAPGPDGIYNEYLLHLNKKAQAEILYFANLIWTTGAMPRSFLPSYIVPVLKPGKAATEPKSYRPIALTSCLSKLVERLVINRLTPELERRGVILNWQSGFRTNRSSMDPLMKLISDIHLGFQQKPALHTVLGKLDLSSAYNRVEHTHLLALFHQLGLPPIYTRFYHGFLHDRCFRVRYNQQLSKWAHEFCGCPQGAVSSPVLFDIYVDALLRHIRPAAEALHIPTPMFADDLTIWKVGNDPAKLAADLTNLIGNYIQPWVREFNMLLSPGKCESFYFTASTHDHTWPSIIVDGEVLQPPKNHICRILGVFFDQHITMCGHIAKLIHCSIPRVKLLTRVANSMFGCSQSDLRTMYIAFIRSALEYAAPVWYPHLSKTQLKKLTTVETRCLRLVLGLPHGTPNADLYLEANLAPLETRLRWFTGFMAEKYRRLPPNDPLYIESHRALPPLRTKRSSWQYLSDQILIDAGFDPARNDVHHPKSPDLFSLVSREPMSFVPAVLPWDTAGFDRIIINTTLGHVNKKNPPTICRKHAEESLALIHNCDYAFWTDASVLPSHSSCAACIGHPLSNITPALQQNTISHLDFVCSRPSGLVAASTEAENDALQLPPLLMAKYPSLFINSHIFVGTDTASALASLKLGPLHHPKCTDIPFTTTLKMYRDIAVATNSTFLLQYVPSHVGLPGNSAVDSVAKFQAYQYPMYHQSTRSVSLRTIKCILKQSQQQQWLSQPLQQTNRFLFVGKVRSRLKTRRSLPRALQCLFSQWRFGSTPGCGRHPRHLGLLQMDRCRFCGYSYESNLHLLLDCPGTAAYRALNGLSVHTLFSETPDNIIAIARFDVWIRSVIPLSLSLTTSNRLSTLTIQVCEARKKRKAGSNPETAASLSKRSKSSCAGRTLIMTHPGQLNLLNKKRHYSSNEAVSSKRTRTIS